jgi:prephenate dehydratase
VAYSGESGSFAEDALLAYFGPVQSIGLGGFREVFEAVQSGQARAGVLPIENLVNGTVREVYDLLLQHELEISGEVIVPVQLALAALPGQSIEAVERVYSHIQALGQAERFLRGRPWSLLTTYNTAGAGKLIADGQEEGSAAVLSPRAAQRFGLVILADGIQDVPDNRTRFLVVTRAGEGRGEASSGEMRTTLVLGVRNEPGTLREALAVFAAHGLNMSKLESRPSREVPWEYVFWVDLDADLRTGSGLRALDDLRTVASTVRVLGTYERAPDPPD